MSFQFKNVIVWLLVNNAIIFRRQLPDNIAYVQKVIQEFRNRMFLILSLELINHFWYDSRASWRKSLTQESPPAWTQEAYRPPCSEYSFCCPTRVPPPGGGTWPGSPPGGYLTRVPPRGVPDPGTPPEGVRVPPRGGSGYPPGGSGYPPPVLPHGILGNVAKHYGIWVPPPVDRQIDGWTDACQNITFPRTTYAGGKKSSV